MRTILRRCLLVSTILVSTLVLSGCSYFANFVLVNRSSNAIVVEYYMRPTDVIRYPEVKARLASLHQHEANPREFNAFPDERLWVSGDRLAARVKLLPDEVLFLAEHEISKIHNEPVLKSGIVKLSIFRESGSSTFEGDQVFSQFVPGRSGIFPQAPGIYTLTVNE
jgi:hypothetical protein